VFTQANGDMLTKQSMKGQTAA